MPPIQKPDFAKTLGSAIPPQRKFTDRDEAQQLFRTGICQTLKKPV